MIMKQYKVCDQDGCEASACVGQLMSMSHVQQYMKKPIFAQGKLKVLVALSDGSNGWTSFSLDEFGYEANMCKNHTTGIPASNYSHLKYYKSREIYDSVYDYMVRKSKIGVQEIVEKVHAAFIRWLIDNGDPEAAAYWEKTWSMASGHGRRAIVQAMYAGCNSNASLESMWKNKPDICPPSAPLGTMLGGLVHTIQELG